MDPTLSCIHTPNPARYGQKVDYTITFGNPNPTPIGPVKVTFSYSHDRGVGFESASDGGHLSGTTVIWDSLGMLSPAGSRTLSLSLRAPIGMNPGGNEDYSTEVTISCDPASPVTINDYTRVLPWERLECTIDCPLSAALGTQFLYSINITNKCEITVTSVRFNAGLSEHVTFVSASDLGTFIPGSGGAGGTIRWEGGPWSLNPDKTKTFTATVKVNSNAPVGMNLLKIRVFELMTDESASKGPVEAYTSVTSSESPWYFLRILIARILRLFRIKKP